MKRKFPGWRVLLPRYCIQRQNEWYQPLICIFSVYGEIIKTNFKNSAILIFFCKKTTKKLLKENSQDGRLYFPGTTFNDKSNGANSLSVSFLYVKNSTKKFEKYSEKGHFNVIFEKKTSKKLLKQNSQVGAFCFPGTAFNDKSNGTNPHLYLFCM